MDSRGNFEGQSDEVSADFIQQHDRYCLFAGWREQRGLAAVRVYARPENYGVNADGTVTYVEIDAQKKTAP